MSGPSSEGLLAVLETMQDDLRRFLIARTGNVADAEDILADLWVKVRRLIPGPIAHSDSYLYAMANNLVLDRIRAARRRERREQDWTAERLGIPLVSGEIADDSLDPEEKAIEQDSVIRLRAAIARLPAGAKRVLIMHKIDGLSHGEVAEALGISKSAVEKHMAVAMTHLRRLLGD